MKKVENQSHQKKAEKELLASQFQNVLGQP